MSDSVKALHRLCTVVYWRDWKNRVIAKSGFVIKSVLWKWDLFLTWSWIASVAWNVYSSIAPVILKLCITIQSIWLHKGNLAIREVINTQVLIFFFYLNLALLYLWWIPSFFLCRGAETCFLYQVKMGETALACSWHE